jgi:hypothetical protein
MLQKTNHTKDSCQKQQLVLHLRSKWPRAHQCTIREIDSGWWSLDMETLFHWVPVPWLVRVVGIVVSVLSDHILTTRMFSLRMSHRGLHPFFGPPFIPSFNKVRKFLLNLTMKCWNLAFNAQGSRVIIVVLQVRPVGMKLSLPQKIDRVFWVSPSVEC